MSEERTEELSEESIILDAIEKFLERDVRPVAHAMEQGTATVLVARGGRDICATVEACVRSGKSGKLETVA